MSAFIVPMGSLPSISSISDAQKTQAASAQQGGGQFADMLQQAIAEVGSASAESQAATLNLALGGSDDLHTGSIAAVKASAAVNYTTSLVSAAIRSYNELIRMQI